MGDTKEESRREVSEVSLRIAQRFVGIMQSRFLASAIDEARVTAERNKAVVLTEQGEKGVERLPLLRIGKGHNALR